MLSTLGQARAQALNHTLVDGPSITASALLAAGGGFSYPSVFGLRADAGECVRVRATSATFDARFTVVSPDGLVINSANGAAVASGTVTFTYGRFSFGSPGCVAPTPPL